MSENVAVSNTQKTRKEKLKKLIEQAEVLGGCELPEQDAHDENLTEELSKIKSRIRKREPKCVAPTK